VTKDRLFIRVQHPVLPNLSLHPYTSGDVSSKKLFSRFHIIRWTVPVDDTNSKMIGWRVMGPGIDTRGVCDKSLFGYETIDFLEGQVAMRRPERFGKYKLEEIPPIPPNHRERENYKQAQYAPGDHEAIINQRPIAIHALEHPTKFESGLYTFRKLLREALRADATTEAFTAWLREVDGAPNSYCSGHVLEVPEAEYVAREVANRRHIARGIVALLTSKDSRRGAERVAAMEKGLNEFEDSVK
jgi:hypothetical protein